MWYLPHWLHQYVRMPSALSGESTAIRSSALAALSSVSQTPGLHRRLALRAWTR